MEILLASAEVGPFAKVGGLADVVGSLPKALAKLGHEVRVVMPAYGMVLDDPRWKIKKIVDDLPVVLSKKWTESVTVYELNHNGVHVWLIGSPTYFSGVLRSEDIYPQPVDAYLFFSAALFAVCEHFHWIPDIIHSNDWHTGFIPVLLREKSGPLWRATASVFSIHNLAYQGNFPYDVLERMDLPSHIFNYRQVEAFGQVNFMKAGMTFSDQVNTVSPTYALEIQLAQFGCQLEGVSSHLAHQGRFRGILNGIDTDEFDPETDPFLLHHFSARRADDKALCRDDLLREIGMEPIEGAPVIAMVSRLAIQKGFDLLLESFSQLFELPVQMVVLGAGDVELGHQLRLVEKQYPFHFRFSEGFNLGLAPRIYAGADMFLMPSLFEPCGLGQLIALRYGTIPIVRKTGGLGDTIWEGHNGFVFSEYSSEDLIAAVKRAVAAYQKPRQWMKLAKLAMKEEVGWGDRAKLYERMYLDALTVDGVAAQVINSRA
ncbi:MAG: glycogen synthase [Armatimonadetes bacterium]|nr:glycogen synthase [Armatimonadota bacterium]